MARAAIARKTLLGIVPNDSPFFAFHPVTRLTLLLFFSIAPLFIDLPELNLLLTALAILLLRWGHVQLSQIRRYIPLLATVALFMFAVAMLAPGDRTTLTPIHFLGKTFYAEPLWWAFVSYCRLVSMLFGAILYFSTNRERDLLVALRTLRIPFAATYVLALSIRSAAMFMEDFSTIREAQQARGLDLNSMSIADKIKLYTMYAVPLFALALRRADEISNALFARGYTLTASPATGGRRGDYLLKKYNLGPRDYTVNLLLLLSLLLTAVFGKMFHAFSADRSLLRGLFW